MAKRLGSLSSKKMGKSPHKTKKRLAAKVEMLKKKKKNPKAKR